MVRQAVRQGRVSGGQGRKGCVGTQGMLEALKGDEGRKATINSKASGGEGFVHNK